MEDQKGEGEVNAIDSRNQGKELRLKLSKPLARRGRTCCTKEKLVMNLQRCPSATGQAQVNVLRNPHLHMVFLYPEQSAGN